VLPVVLQKELETLDLRALSILKTSIRLGKTIIITNAAYGWVEASGRKFLPASYSFILRNRIDIISARQMFED
jgi:hypothetical protein